MKLYLTILLVLCFSLNSKSQENLVSNQSTTYADCIAFYKKLSEKHYLVTIEKVGITDIGLPLQLIKIEKDGDSKNKIRILINNGIHPGEPEGIDASMQIAKSVVGDQSELASSKFSKSILDNCIIYIIPVYNIDGALKRNSTSRANQNGPVEYGFRANSKNLDLNRDFIKMDSRNATTFAEIFQRIKPHVFIDTHTSNGADYQHVLTYIATQKDKLQKDCSAVMTKKIIPVLEDSLNKKNWKPIPYVNAWTDHPDSGWSAFYESPRFATGYAALFNCIGFTVETHMLKPFDQRLSATYDFLKAIIEISSDNKKAIMDARTKANKDDLSKKYFPLNWKTDSSKISSLNYFGYKAKYKKSEVSGMDRLYYDKAEPTQLKVKYYNSYKPIDSVEKPYAYIIPYAWDAVIKRLKANDIEMEQLNVNAQSLNVQVYYIDDYKSASRPYEGHYNHSQVKLHTETQNISFSDKDYIVFTNQPSVRFLIETLEPKAVDSYFNWNFFDAVLAQKEYFSDYVFEDLAAEILKNNPDLQQKLKDKINADPKFASNGAAQLDFVYRNSSYFEKSYLRYPIYRVQKSSDLKWRQY